MEYCVRVRFVDGSTQTHRCKARGHGEAIHKIQRALSNSGLSDLVDFIHKPREVTKESLDMKLEDLIREEIQKLLSERELPEQFGAGEEPDEKELQNQVRTNLKVVYTLLSKAADRMDDLSLFREYASGMSEKQIRKLEERVAVIQKALENIKRARQG